MIAAGAHDLLLVAGIAWTGVLAMVAVALVVRARSHATRILQLDLLAILLIAMLSLIAARQREVHFLDAALALALLSFVATLAAARSAGTAHGERS